MITVTIEAWPLLSELFGGDKAHRYVFKMEAAENSTLEDLIGTLCESNPALGQVFIKTDKKELYGASMSVSVILNSHVITSVKDYRTKLQEGDRMLFVQGFAGG